MPSLRCGFAHLVDGSPLSCVWTAASTSAPSTLPSRSHGTAVLTRLVRSRCDEAHHKQGAAQKHQRYELDSSTFVYPEVAQGEVDEVLLSVQPQPREEVATRGAHDYRPKPPSSPWLPPASQEFTCSEAGCVGRSWLVDFWWRGGTERRGGDAIRQGGHWETRPCALPADARSLV